MATVRAINHGVLLELDRLTAYHLAKALEAHAERCRVNVCPYPDGLRELLDMALETAKSGHSRTVADTTDNLLDAVADLLHDRSDGVFTTYEAAERLRVCERTVRRQIARGELGAVKVGRAWRVPRAEIEAFLIGRGLPGGWHDERRDAA